MFLAVKFRNTLNLLNCKMNNDFSSGSLRNEHIKDIKNINFSQRSWRNGEMFQFLVRLSVPRFPCVKILVLRITIIVL